MGMLLTLIDDSVQIREGLYYNPYFIGGAIAMPKMLADGGTEYDDGTIATESQQAKVTNHRSYAHEHVCMGLSVWQCIITGCMHLQQDAEEAAS